MSNEPGLPTSLQQSCWDGWVDSRVQLAQKACLHALWKLKQLYVKVSCMAVRQYVQCCPGSLHGAHAAQLRCCGVDGEGVQLSQHIRSAF